MSSSFAITTAANSVPLNGARQAQTVFTVSNTSVRSLRGRARLVSDKAADAGWYTLAGNAERDFSVNGTQQYTLQIAVPPTTAAGNYTIRLDMVGVDNPDEDFTQGPTVTFAVPEPVPVKKPFPWWIVAVAAGVIVVGIILAVVFSPKQVEVPTLVGSPLIGAQPTLESAGLKVNVVLATAESANVNVVLAQEPLGGAKVQKGSGVTLTVGVAQQAAPGPTLVPVVDAPTDVPPAAPTPDRQTTTQLTSSPADYGARGQTVTFSAQVIANDGQEASGKVTFNREDGSVIDGCADVPLNQGAANCVAVAFQLGDHTVTAVYGGDDNHDPSSSDPLKITTAAANTSVSVSGDSSFNGIPTWKYRASGTVNNTSSGVALTPAGTLTFHFTDNAAVNADKSCTLDGNGGCSVEFTDGLLYYHVSATFNPSTGDFNSSTSGQVGTGR